MESNVAFAVLYRMIRCSCVQMHRYFYANT